MVTSIREVPEARDALSLPIITHIINHRQVNLITLLQFHTPPKKKKCECVLLFLLTQTDGWTDGCSGREELEEAMVLRLVLSRLVSVGSESM